MNSLNTTDGHGDTDGDGIPDYQDDDMDGDGIPNDQDTNNEVYDTDGDGLSDAEDDDIDGDGIPNDEDDDIDGDGIPNAQDLGNTPDTDIDGDGVSDVSDTDIDGDGLSNSADDDMDGDGIPNDQDPDADGDGLFNEDDPTPEGVLGEQEGGIRTDQLRSKREDRGTLCFLAGHDYRYQIIESVVKHAAPDATELNQMTLVTPERPVDDGRYVSFQGVGGEVVKMIYPDLRNVPIYDCNLEDPEDIEKNIKEYLREKVDLYNQYLDIQLQKAPAHYATHPAAFDFLASVDIAATPNRTYDLIPEDYFIETLGETNIKRLAQLLHYMSE